MTKDFEKVMELFCMGVRGESCAAGQELCIDNIYDISCKQGIWQTVYLALYENYDVSSYEAGMLNCTAINISRREFVFGIVDALKQKGIECCFLKGVAVARFYKNPECRISGDTDILIRREDENLVRKELRKLGFTVEENIGNMYHFEARHPAAGLVEVHIGLYQKHYDELMFNNLLKFDEAYEQIDVDGYRINILGINDGLNHLTAHYIKHFISKGAGIRQLMDMLLYMDFYRKEIDWDGYKQLWSQVSFYGLIKKFKGIGVVCWGFDFEDYDIKDIDDILTDIEDGGLFGFDEEGRMNFLNTYLAENNKGKIENFQNYMKKKYSQKAIWRMFPNKEYLIRGGYKYVKKGEIFIFVAYIHRFIKIIVRTFMKKEKEDLKSNDVHKNRLDFMRRIGLLSEKQKNEKE